MKCLIADDDSLSRRIHGEILSTWFECDYAENGAEAFELFRTSHCNGAMYDLICLDIVMPGSDGHEALGQIRSLERELDIPSRSQAKVIMITSLDDPKTVLESYYKGGTSYIVKPASRKKMAQILKTFKLIT